MRNKKVLITGAAGGIGYCTAQEFAQAGAYLILVDINKAALDKARGQLQSAGALVDAHVIDITNKDEVDQLRDKILARHGSLDVLINNAGRGYHAELKDTSIETWQHLIDINFYGGLYHIYAFLPSMIEQGSGHIVNISSGQAFFRMPTWGAYAAVKLMVGAVSELLHYELRKYDIDVTTVYPYMVNTGFYDGVKTNETLMSKMSMELLPYYSLSPETVGKKIFNAVKNKKQVEDIHPFTSAGRYLNVLSPLSALYNTALTFFMAPAAEKTGDSANKSSGILDSLGSLASVLTGNGGFQIDELMAGEHEFEPGFGPAGKRPMHFKAGWGPNDMLSWLNPLGDGFMTNNLKGTVSIDGLCIDTPCEGRLELRYFDEQKIRYSFTFTVDGVDYSYVGEKVNILPWNLPTSHTTCFGELRKVETNELVSKSITHFHMDTLPELMSSFRLEKAG